MRQMRALLERPRNPGHRRVSERSVPDGYRKHWTQEEITSLFVGRCGRLMDFPDGSQRVCLLDPGHGEDLHEQCLLPLDPPNTHPDATRCAEWLVRIAHDLRQAGDLRLVRLDEDGVRNEPISLADELWLVASALNFGRAMGLATELAEKPNS